MVSLSWFQLLNWTWTWFQTLIHQIRADLNMLYTFGRGPVSGPACPPGTYTKAAYQCCQHATGFKLFRSTRFGGNPSYLAETIIQQGVCSCPKEDRRIKTAGYEHFAGLGREDRHSSLPCAHLAWGRLQIQQLLEVWILEL